MILNDENRENCFLHVLAVSLDWCKIKFSDDNYEFKTTLKTTLLIKLAYSELLYCCQSDK